MQKATLITLFALLHLHFSVCAQTASSNKKINVVFILADDLGYGEVGCYGQTKIKTPNIDGLAKDGIRFTQFYAGSPVCAPSRCCLMTGLHSGHAYVRNNYGTPGYKENINENGNYPIPENTFTIANLFTKAGYVTAAIGKWGLGNYDNSGDPLKHGFDYFYGYYDQRHAHNYFTTHLYENGRHDTLNNPPINVHPKFDSAGKASKDPKDYVGNEYSTDKMTGKAVQFINAHADEPFFLYLPYTLPHAVLQAPQKYIGEYISSLQEKSGWSVTNNGIPTDYPLSTYAAQVTYLDVQVGIILNELHKNGLDENTMVIFTSDNGASDGEKMRSDFFNSCGGLRGFKSDLYEGGIREPFIVKWPGNIQPGTVDTRPIAMYDIMQTFADLLDVKAQKNDGISLLPLFAGKESKGTTHKYLYWEFPGKGGQVAVRTGDWKGIRSGLKKDTITQWQLYNIGTDSAEMHDVAGQHPQLIRKMKRIVKKAHEEPVKPEWDIYVKLDPGAPPPKQADQ